MIKFYLFLSVFTLFTASSYGSICSLESKAANFEYGEVNKDHTIYERPLLTIGGDNIYKDESLYKRSFFHNIDVEVESAQECYERAVRRAKRITPQAVVDYFHKNYSFFTTLPFIKWRYNDGIIWDSRGLVTWFNEEEAFQLGDVREYPYILSAVAH